LAEAASAGLAKDGLPDDQVMDIFLTQAVGQIEVTDDEARTFFEANKEMVGGASFDQVKDGIRALLVQEKQAAAVGGYIDSLGQRREIKVDRAWAALQYAGFMENPVEKARRSGIPTMVEFGATGCVPCDMMQPILEALREKYGTSLNIPFVHVRENPVLGARYGINAIPVQVFYDADGREFFRHEGFYAEDRIVEVLKKLGL
jgi:thiol-disulfide isomerase/thioredoxin